MFQLKNLKIGYGATMTSGDNDNKKYGNYGINPETRTFLIESLIDL